MVLGTSALYALLTGEAEADAMVGAIEQDPVRLVSTGTLVEIGIVVEARHGDPGARALDRLLATLRAETQSVTADQVDRAREGYRRFGKGRHAAGLNFGDLFAYALATTTGEPLLVTGADFGLTDAPVVPY